MSNILIRCPTSGNAVPTGLDTNKIDFEALGKIQFAVVCSACGKTHRWKKPKAWIEGAAPVGRQPSSSRAIASPLDDIAGASLSTCQPDRR
jgi:hypothetical protein